MALEPAVARWAAGPFELGPEHTFRPMVIDASSVPRLDAIAPEKREASSALLSLVLHIRDIRGEDDLPILRLALDDAIRGVDAFGGQSEYAHVAAAAVRKQFRPRVEAIMARDLAGVPTFQEMAEHHLRQKFRAIWREEGQVQGRAEAARAFCRKLAGPARVDA